MKIHSYEVPESVITAIQSAMTGSFTASDLADAAVNAGAPRTIPGKIVGVEYCASRIADRLIQKARKTGLINFKGGKWTRVKD